jgi:hypothetical protein
VIKGLKAAAGRFKPQLCLVRLDQHNVSPPLTVWAMLCSLQARPRNIYLYEKFRYRRGQPLWPLPARTGIVALCVNATAELRAAFQDAQASEPLQARTNTMVHHETFLVSRVRDVSVVTPRVHSLQRAGISISVSEKGCAPVPVKRVRISGVAMASCYADGRCGPWASRWGEVAAM